MPRAAFICLLVRVAVGSVNKIVSMVIFFSLINLLPYRFTATKFNETVNKEQ